MDAARRVGPEQGRPTAADPGRPPRGARGGPAVLREGVSGPRRYPGTVAGRSRGASTPRWPRSGHRSADHAVRSPAGPRARSPARGPGAPRPVHRARRAAALGDHRRAVRGTARPLAVRSVRDRHAAPAVPHAEVRAVAQHQRVLRDPRRVAAATNSRHRNSSVVPQGPGTNRYALQKDPRRPSPTRIADAPMAAEPVPRAGVAAARSAAVVSGAGPADSARGAWAARRARYRPAQLARRCCFRGRSLYPSYRRLC